MLRVKYQITSLDNKGNKFRKDSGYTLPPQLDQNQQHQQQQFVHASTHHIHHPTTKGQVPVSSYYPVYASLSQQQLHHPIGQQQYPVYVMPVGPTQPYNMALQPNIADPILVASGRSLIPQSGRLRSTLAEQVVRNLMEKMGRKGRGF